MCTEHWAKVPEPLRLDCVRMRDELRALPPPPPYKCPQEAAFREKLDAYGKRLRQAVLLVLGAPADQVGEL